MIPTVTAGARNTPVVKRQFDHTYCKQLQSVNSSQGVEPLPTGSTSLQESSGTISSHNQCFDVGKKVKIRKCGITVGLATIMDGRMLHGTELPAGYIKVAVNEVCGNITPPVKGKFTEEFVEAGEIHGWPVKDVILD